MNAVSSNIDTPVDVEAITPAVERQPSHIFNPSSGVLVSRNANGSAAPSTDSTTSTPEALRSWFSIKIFRTVLFCLFIILVFSVTSVLLFVDKMSTDQWLGSTSSLLFLMSPSPLDTLRNKDKKNK